MSALVAKWAAIPDSEAALRAALDRAIVSLAEGDETEAQESERVELARDFTNRHASIAFKWRGHTITTWLTRQFDGAGIQTGVTLVAEIGYGLSKRFASSPNRKVDYPVCAAHSWLLDVLGGVQVISVAELDSMLAKHSEVMRAAA